MKKSIRRITVKAPATTANLGPGFDAMALALNLYCTITFEILASNKKSVPLFTFADDLSEDFPDNQSNLIYKVLSKHWQGNRALLKRVRMHVQSSIPAGKGLGSSAAVTIASTWAAYALSKKVPNPQTVLAKASAVEGHCDNVAASMLGSMIVVSANKKEIQTQQLTWPSRWRTIIVTPARNTSTKKSRALLPKRVSHDEAVHNLQNAALLTAAVANQDEEAMRHALRDKLHEPYRMHTVPELKQIRQVLADLPVMGVVLSGAGSSVLVIVNERYKKQTLAKLNEWADHKMIPPQIHDLQVDKQGLKIRHG